jgi:hypothetical protein
LKPALRVTGPEAQRDGRRTAPFSLPGGFTFTSVSIAMTSCLAIGRSELSSKSVNPVFEERARDRAICAPGRLLKKPDERDLSEVERLPEDLKSQLLNAVLLREKERIIDVIGLVSVIDPAPGRKLTRRADALELSPIMRAVMSKGAP